MWYNISQNPWPISDLQKMKEKYVTNLIGPDLQMLKLRFSFYRVAKVAKMDILKHILTFMLVSSTKFCQFRNICSYILFQLTSNRLLVSNLKIFPSFKAKLMFFAHIVLSQMHLLLSKWCCLWNLHINKSKILEI